MVYLRDTWRATTKSDTAQQILYLEENRDSDRRIG